jgi:glutamate synthase domain-containing protein 3
MALDNELISKCASALDSKKPVKITLPIKNSNRTVGAMLSGELSKRYGSKGLNDDTIHVHLKGSAGQSFGAFLAKGITFELEGDSNDYLGKGLSGGKIIVYPPKGSTFPTQENMIIGNTVLYGATGGEVYVAGMAGERFAVRNSGAVAVIEGVGDHGCEYMTNGVVVVLGQTGRNFAAGMSGGIAYVYDKNQLFDTLCNLDMVDIESVTDPKDMALLKSLVEKHVKYTGSAYSSQILKEWRHTLPYFVKVMPIDYRRALERLSQEAHTDQDTTSVTEEVFK